MQRRRLQVQAQHLASETTACAEVTSLLSEVQINRSIEVISCWFVAGRDDHETNFYLLPFVGNYHITLLLGLKHRIAKTDINYLSGSNA